MASFRNSLLQTLLVVAAATPAVGCGGETTDGTSTTGGAGGSSSGSSGQSGAAGASATGGAAGAAGGVSTGGAAGAATGGSGGASVGGAAGAAAGGSAGAVSTGGSGGGGPVCENAQPVTVGDDQPTGFVRCGNGAILRVEPRECPNLIKPQDGQCFSEPGTVGDPCETNADCTKAPYGVCGLSLNGPCQCDYGCVQDSDCAADELCLCGTPVGRCVKASCKAGSDCALGCAQYETGLPGCGTQAFACLTPQDECVSNEQCEAALCHIENPGDPRQCEPYSCAVGRPLVVEQGWRLAALRASAAWG